MKLVEYQEPVFKTIQGEGFLVGTPSTFVRLWGCDYACDWCDSRGAWKPTSVFREVSVQAVADRIIDFGVEHVVITGGNPLLQGDEVSELITLLGCGFKVTIETQGSVPHKALRQAELVSVSPKLEHQPYEWVHCLRGSLSAFLPSREVAHIQCKVVVVGPAHVSLAVELLDDFRERAVREYGYQASHIHCYLQPESSRGIQWAKQVSRTLLESGPVDGTIRVLPQIHKTSLGVI